MRPAARTAHGTVAAVAAALLTFCTAAPATAAAPLRAVDWTSITPSTSGPSKTTAVGYVNGQKVTLVANLNSSSISPTPQSTLDGSSTAFNNAHFTPQLATSGRLVVDALGNIVTYTLTFEKASNFRLHLTTVRSTIVFSGSNFAKVSGTAGFTSVSGTNQISNADPAVSDEGTAANEGGPITSVTFQATNHCNGCPTTLVGIQVLIQSPVDVGTGRDPAFNDGLPVLSTSPSGTTAFEDLLIDEQNRTISGGAKLIERLRSDGTYDTSFGGTGADGADGQITPTYNATSQTLAGLFRDPSGRVGAGWAFPRPLVGSSRYTASGAEDQSYGANGLSPPADLKAPGDTNQVNVVRALPGGGGATTFIGKTGNLGQPQYYRVLRLDADGNRDQTFGTNGLAAGMVPGSQGTPPTPVPDIATGLVDSQGRVLLAGSSFAPGNNYEMLVMRLTNTGAVDTTFGTNGSVFV